MEGEEKYIGDRGREDKIRKKVEERETRRGGGEDG